MASNGFMVREDQFVIHVQVVSPDPKHFDTNFPGVTSWTSLEGGAIQAEDVFTRPGGLLPGVNLGGPVKRSDATVKRQYTSGMHPYILALDAVCGVARMHVSWFPIDANSNLTGGNPVSGTGWQLNGVLKEVQIPTMDANATAVGFIGLVMGADVELVRIKVH